MTPDSSDVGPWTAIQRRWPELRVTDPLPVPALLRVGLSVVVAMLCLFDVLQFTITGIHVSQSPGTDPWMEVLGTVGGTYLPILGTLAGPRLGISTLVFAYALALMTQSTYAVFVPGVLCTLVLTMWLRWGVGLTVLGAQWLAALGLGIFVTETDAWAEVVALWALLSFGALLGFTTRFFRCRTLLSARTIARLEHDAALVRAAERQELARELHDLVAHNVTATALRANAGLLSQDADMQRTALRDIANGASGTIADLRRLVSILREEPVGISATRISPLDGSSQSADSSKPAPPTPTMSMVLQNSVQILRDSGFRNIEVQEGPDWEYVTTSVRSACQRVVQEACANIVRHGSPAGPVSIRVEIVRNRARGPRAEVEVSNKLAHARRREVSTPAAVLSTGGFGLLGLRERVSVFGGELTSGPREGRWIVHARLPLQEIDLP
ncbi:histidine kinase [Kocuria coralli]|uniref:histidine kinase n=1 Tax=Kocuria coralli TaxID=1461025 RepID=UPI0015F2D215|nr:histidine kinase [Kocuria coralli]